MYDVLLQGVTSGVREIKWREMQVGSDLLCAEETISAAIYVRN